MSLEQALAIVKAAGFHISKPRTKSRTAERPALNAIGNPFSSQCDPNRNLKHKTSARGICSRRTRPICGSRAIPRMVPIESGKRAGGLRRPIGPRASGTVTRNSE
jgi:hypothetical protein